MEDKIEDSQSMNDFRRKKNISQWLQFLTKEVVKSMNGTFMNAPVLEETIIICKCFQAGKNPVIISELFLT